MTALGLLFSGGCSPVKVIYNDQSQIFSYEDISRSIYLIEEWLNHDSEIAVIKEIAFIEDDDDEVLLWLNRLKTQNPGKHYSASMMFRTVVQTSPDSRALNPDTELDIQFHVARNQFNRLEIVKGSVGQG